MGLAIAIGVLVYELAHGFNYEKLAWIKLVLMLVLSLFFAV